MPAILPNSLLKASNENLYSYKEKPNKKNENIEERSYFELNQEQKKASPIKFFFTEVANSVARMFGLLDNVVKTVHEKNISECLKYANKLFDHRESFSTEELFDGAREIKIIEDSDNFAKYTKLDKCKNDIVRINTLKDNISNELEIKIKKCLKDEKFDIAVQIAQERQKIFNDEGSENIMKAKVSFTSLYKHYEPYLVKSSNSNYFLEPDSADTTDALKILNAAAEFFKAIGSYEKAGNIYMGLHDFETAKDMYGHIKDTGGYYEALYNKAHMRSFI